VLGRILVVIGGLLALVLFAALFAPYFIDWTDFRKDFETQASRIIGKKVVVHGAVDARLLPFPTVTMNDVRVGENEKGEALVTVDRFSMQSELAPFLSGEALIYNMRIEHPKLKLRLTDDGTLDWVKTGKPLIPASSVVLESVAISDGEVMFIDDQTGHNRHITDLNLKLSAKTLAGPWKVAGTGAIDKQAGSFTINTSVPENNSLFLKMRLLPDKPGIVADLDGSIGLKDLRPQYAGTFRIRERGTTDSNSDEAEASPTAAPRISGQFELSNDRIRVGKYEFQMGNPTDPYIVTGEATIDAGRTPDFLLTAVGQQIDLSRFGNDNEGAPDDNAATAKPVRERVRALMTLLADIPIPQMQGKAHVSLPAVVAKDTLIRDVKLEMRPAGNGWQIDEAEAQLPGRTTLSAKGKLTVINGQSFEGELLLASNQPSGFAEWVTGKVPDTVRQLKTAGFSANVSITPDLQRFENLEIAFGPASLKGRLEHEMKDGQNSALSTELSGNQFDLDTVVALGGLLTGEPSVASLANHQIAAKLKFASFQAFGLQASGVDTAFTLADGGISNLRLAIDDFYGARVGAEGDFTTLSKQTAGEARVTLKATDASALLRLMADRLPAHPVLDRLSQSAEFYADSDLALDLKLGKGDWPVEAKLTGTARGSRIDATLAAQSFGLANPEGMTLDATLSNPDAWIMLGQAGLPTIPFDADQDGMLTLKINQPAESEPQVTLGFASGTTTIGIDGQMQLDAPHFLNGSYNLSVDSGDIAPYLVMNGIVLPRLGEGLPFNATAHVYAAPEAITLDNIKGNTDDNAFSGILSMNRNDPKPVFAGQVAVQSADLGWLAESVYGQITDPLTGDLSRVAVPKDTGLPVPASIALSAGQFHFGDLGTVDGFHATFDASPGRINITDATGAFFTGRFKGQVELGSTDGNAFFRSRLNISDADFQTAFWQYQGQPAASARSNLSLVIDSTGTTPQAMLETATGSGAFKLSGLKIAGINDKALQPILDGADKVAGDISDASIQPFVTEALFSGALNLPDLDIPFTITGAKLRADKISAESPDLSIDAEASLSLENAAIASSIDLTLKPGEQAVAGAEPTITLGWNGSFVTPERSIDLTQMTSFLSLRKFEQERRRVEILQAKMAEKQRLRRESGLYRARQAERQRLAEKREAEKRLLIEAQKKLGELARQEEEERRKLREEQLQSPDLQDQIQ
jgi:uncharacterized protein involved in outer membrane biogenesis